MRISSFAAALLLATTITASASPITQTIGPATILGTDYTVSVLGDSAGNPTGQSFNALSPTITFTTAADATAAGNALLAAFGSSFDWQPWSGFDGGRIVFAADANTYDEVTLCCGTGIVNGPFNLPRNDDNLFTFIQFEPLVTSAVPEPLTLSIFGVGLAGTLAVRRRKKTRA